MPDFPHVDLCDCADCNAGRTKKHPMMCPCDACMARRRSKANEPRLVAEIEAKAARLPPDQAAMLRRAFGR